MRVRIQSLNIPTMNELARIIYHQTGIQYDHKFAAQRGDCEKEFLNEIKDITFIVLQLFERRESFISHPLWSIDSQIKDSIQKSLVMIQYFRDSSINIDYEPIESDMKLLEKRSPPLHDWVHSIASWKRKVLIEKIYA